MRLLLTHSVEVMMKINIVPARYVQAKNGWIEFSPIGVKSQMPTLLPSVPKFTAILYCIWRGGGLFSFFRLIFTVKTRHFQGCLREWSRGHQARRHPCNLGHLAIFYNAKNSQKFTFPVVFMNGKRVDRISPPPPQ